jgi:hypothetical protein
MTDVSGCFPAPFPDETLYSLCARFHLISASDNPLKTRQNIGCDRTFFGFSDVPIGCGCLISHTALGRSITFAGLIEHHTWLPYFSPFLSEQQLKKCLTAMISLPRRRSLGFFLSTHGQLHGKYCEECVVADECQVGQAYWHREHQPAGVFVCHLHKCLLHVMGDVWFKNHIQFLALPNNHNIRAHSERIDCTNSTLLQEIAVITKQLIHHEIQPYTLKLSTQRSADLVRATEKIVARLPFLGEFKPLALEPAGFLKQPLRSMLENNARYHHPLMHIVLALASNGY